MEGNTDEENINVENEIKDEKNDPSVFQKPAEDNVDGSDEIIGHADG